MNENKELGSVISKVQIHLFSILPSKLIVKAITKLSRLSVVECCRLNKIESRNVGNRLTKGFVLETITKVYI